MSGADSDSEPEVEGLKEEGKIVIMMKPTNHEPEVPFKVKQTTPFEKVFKAFEGKLRVDQGSYQYQYNGQRVYDDTTPKMLEMKIGKRYDIDAHLPQFGGQCIDRD
ncbi:uncharacterized protein L201_003545 [Kwoniella dendrophila CBS 6074]|uniref:Rad60/SUMO-like domain-containing protein n=1 Tax=Kwoniella dendrophila CBS 6074 TaxID=1295534 RepID=A0AAX4JVP8_9TREE